ncbi:MULTISPECIES: FMN-binding protein [Aeromicrobium]|uniref:FMN-binding protein n=1 Tax=Aeromicrobium phoceense TaxID=2754045 RepID=A0A838XB45_9ACTN|nr:MULTISPECIES: FMN-binding protein [Aeromicrobium]MBA4607765.1 FMN-binding protein [Aeromicrobium phoceense]RYJ06729.1 MAG: FMN-binding protein [Actinomycetales bacterium]
MNPTKRRTYAALAASTALLTLAACGSDAAEDDASSSSKTPSATTPSASEPAASAPAGAAAFTPGEYEATGSYTTPDGQTQSIDVEVTLAADGTITELDADGNAEGGNSEQFQGKFESGIDAQVEGRKITDLDVDKVSGSSLTSGGFNDAIDQIIGQAQA